jgi:uncharacterized membrane protein
MRRTSRIACLSALALFWAVPPSLAEGPTEESLLSAWETRQRTDPKTVVFEKVEPKVYRFETERFPYEGKIRVLNLSIDDPYAGPGSSQQVGSQIGVVEAALEDLPSGFMMHHAHSYGLWQAENTFYWDPVKGTWLTSREFQNRIQEEAGGWYGWLGIGLSGLFWIFFLVVVLGVLFLLTRKASRQMKTAMAAQDKVLSEQERAMSLMERSIEVNEASNALLERILGTLEDLRSAPPRR